MPMLLQYSMQYLIKYLIKYQGKGSYWAKLFQDMKMYTL